MEQFLPPPPPPFPFQNSPLKAKPKNRFIQTESKDIDVVNKLLNKFFFSFFSLIIFLLLSSLFISLLFVSQVFGRIKER